ncbi:MAG: hypothetical protein AAGJ40_01435 [Planctomycetota bacterium]
MSGATRRRKRATLSPSLFPFLAVLVCTLGTLILLLALVAQDAKESVVQAARKDVTGGASVPNPNIEPEPPSESSDESQLTAADADRLIDEGEFRLRELVNHRDAQTEDLEKRRDQLTHLQSHTRRLQDELQRLRDEVEIATSSEPNATIDRQTLVLMQSEIDQLESEIAELKESKTGERPRVVLVPHKGPNGTDRRPIYVECDDQGVLVHPEGVRITTKQLAAATSTRIAMGNPLDAALRTIRLHAMKFYGDVAPPYPLLVVRPDGIAAYRLATAAMGDWDDQFGYELVPSEVDLAFPRPDANLRKELELVVHEANVRNIGIIARGNGGADADAARDSPGPRSSQGPPTNSYGTSTLIDADSDFTPDPDAAPNPYAVASHSGMPSDVPRRRLPTLSAKALDQQARSNGFHSDGSDFNGIAGGYAASMPGSRGNSFGAAPETMSESLDQLLQETSGRGKGEFAQTSTTNSSASSKPSSTSTLTGDASSATGTNSDAAAGVTGTGGRDAAGMPQGQPGQSASAAAQQSSASGVTPAPPPGVDPSELESLTEIDPNQPIPTPPITSRQGNDWALPSHMAGQVGTEMVRPIAVICAPDRFVLLDREQPVADFPITQRGVQDATLKMATAIRDRVATWGATIPGGRWQPQLEVRVQPHAERRFHELRTLMQGSGIDVIRSSR